MDAFLSTMQKLISRHMERVGSELEKWRQILDSKARIVTGSWANPGIMQSYVSYYPHADPLEVSVDSSIHLIIQENSVVFVCDICLSNGNLISRIADCVIEARTEKEILDQLEILSMESSQKVLAYLKKHYF